MTVCLHRKKELLYKKIVTAVDTVIINGKLVLRDKKFTCIDADEIYAKSRECAKKLWKKADRIK